VTNSATRIRLRTLPRRRETRKLDQDRSRTA
jgi:hypothetical protein